MDGKYQVILSRFQKILEIQSYMYNRMAHSENLRSSTMDKIDENAFIKLRNDQRVLEYCIEGFENVEKELEGKQVVLFLGKTGAGKSTVVNFLNGVNFQEKGKGNNLKVVIGQDQSILAKIGHHL